MYLGLQTFRKGRFCLLGKLDLTLDLLGRVVSRGKRDSGSSSLGNGESEEDVGGEIGRFVAGAENHQSLISFLSPF